MLPILKTSIWVSALLRRANSAGAFAALTNKGDQDVGAVLVKVCTLDGRAVLYRPMRDMEGDRVWLPKGPMGERDIDQLIRKRRLTDPDLWVVEIEDKLGRCFLVEPIEKE